MEGCCSTYTETYTNSGKSGKWEGLDVPASRSLKVDAAGNKSKVYAPVDTFGQMYMNADPWHTNTAGCELITQALLEVLKNNERVKHYLRQTK